MGAECSQPRNDDSESDNPLDAWKAFGLIDFPDQGEDDDDFDIDQVQPGRIRAIPLIPATRSPLCCSRSGKRLTEWTSVDLLCTCVILQACSWEEWRGLQTKTN